jgi:hypothetical protein
MKNDICLSLIDKRLSARLHVIIGNMVEKRSCILRKLSGCWGEEMGIWRFLKNTRFGWESLRLDCVSQISEKVAGRHVLCIQDSSTISLQASVSKRKGFGRMGSTGDHPGIVVHPGLVLDAAQGSCLGISDIQIHDGQRAFPGVSKKSLEHRQAEAKTKKTGIWLQSGKASRERLQKASHMTHIADREGDFFEMLFEFSQKKVPNEDFIVRSNKDRQLGHRQKPGHAPYKGQPNICVATGQEGQPVIVKHRSLMSELLGKLPVRAITKMKLPATHKRESRMATFAIRFVPEVPICRPNKIGGRTYEGEPLPGSVRIAVVEVQEITEGLTHDQTPVYWRLYTSHAVNSAEDALEIVKWYTWRWKIELLFAATKSNGLNLEYALIEHAERLKKLAILVLMAAVQVIQLIQARDGQTDQLINEVFTEDEVLLLKRINPKLEGKTLLQKNPHADHTLAFAAWVIARLGSWKGYKTHRPPGIKTMSRGLQVFYQIKEAADLLSG